MKDKELLKKVIKREKKIIKLKKNIICSTITFFQIYGVLTLFFILFIAITRPCHHHGWVCQEADILMCMLSLMITSFLISIYFNFNEECEK